MVSIYVTSMTNSKLIYREQVTGRRGQGAGSKCNLNRFVILFCLSILVSLLVSGSRGQL